MSDKLINETDTDNSSDTIIEPEEPLFITYGWLVILLICLVSFIICLIFLYCLTDIKQCTVCTFFIYFICLIYLSCFISLNVMSMFDLMFSNGGLDKFINMIETYYDIFNWVDKIMGYIIFNITIYFMESGYNCFILKILDYFIRLGKRIPKHIGIIIARLIITGGILTVLIIFRKHYDLDTNPFEYLGIILDCFGMFEIYRNVGFFMYQLISDFNRKKDSFEINRYYRYSLVKIIEKTEKYMKKANECYKELKKDAKIFLKNNQSKYYQYLKEVFGEMEKMVKEYGFEVEDGQDNFYNNEMNARNVNDNQEHNYTMNFEANNDNIQHYNNNNHQISNNNDFIYNNQSNNYNPSQFHNDGIPVSKDKFDSSETGRVSKKYSKEKKIELKKTDFERSKCIRKFKRAVRRIDKLKKLYNNMGEETREDLNRYQLNKKCSCKYVILFIAFSIVLLTDFLLPIFTDADDKTDYTKSAEEKTEPIASTVELIFSIHFQ